jgi:WD40 repeat protein
MNPFRRLPGLALLLLLCVPAWGAEPAPRLDTLGDPLPPYALARLGTSRWRQRWSVAALACSADGRVLACNSYEEGTCTWDVASGRKLRHLGGPDDNCRCLAISADGKRVAAYLKGSVHVYDAATGDRVGRFPLGGGRQWYRFALSADGTKIVLCHEEDGAGLWDVDSGKHLASFLQGFAAGFGREGKTLLLGRDQYVSVWDVANHEELRQCETETQQMTVSADGRTLATRGKKTVRLWDPDTGKEKRSLAVPDKELRTGGSDVLTLSADGRTAALAGQGHLLAWDCTTGKERFRRLDSEWYTAAALSPDGKMLFWGVKDSPTIHRWDLAADKELVAASGHENRVWAVAFGPDGKSLATGGIDRTVRLWKLAGNAAEPGPVLPTGEAYLGGRFAWSPDGKFLALPLSDEEAGLREATTGKVVRTWSVSKGAYAFAFSADGKYVAIGDGFRGRSNNPQGRALVCEASTGRVVRTIEGHEDIVCSVTFSPDGKRLASGSDCVRVWDLATGRESRRFRDGTRRCDALAFTADGSKLVAAGEAAFVWDLATGEQLQRLGPEHKGVQGVALSPDNHLLATAGHDGFVRLWDFATGTELAQLAGHVDQVHAVTFSPYGKLLASAGADTTVLLWDVSAIRAGAAKVRPALTKEDLAWLWDDLGKADVKGNKAVWVLADDPAAVAFLKERLPGTSSVDTERVAKLIKQLDNDVFDRREEASKELDKLGGSAVPALREMLKRDPSAEVRRRIDKLLAKHDARTLLMPEGDTLRVARAIQVLELIGTPAAREVLRGLRDGPPSRAAEDARAALERLDRSTGGNP